jgi:predicted nucleic acid-binding protein
MQKLCPAYPVDITITVTHREAILILNAARPYILKELLMPLGTVANLTSDAHLAALAIEYGARLFSMDNDFRCFPTLRWTIPIE